MTRISSPMRSRLSWTTSWAHSPAAKSSRRHIRFLFEHGSLYKICDGDLLAHACVPLNDDGALKEVDIFGVTCKGKSLYDEAQKWVRTAFESDDEAMREKGRDLIWYLWLGPGSPLFAKSKMATFEIYLCKDKAARKEVKNAFYLLLDEAEPYERIFEDFGLDPAHAASSAVTCQSRQRTARIPLRRAAASSASMAACQRRTARRRDCRDTRSRAQTSTSRFMPSRASTKTRRRLSPKPGRLRHVKSGAQAHGACQ